MLSYHEYLKALSARFFREKPKLAPATVASRPTEPSDGAYLPEHRDARGAEKR